MTALFSINECSTLPELLSEIRLSFETKEFEEIQRIVMRREEGLNLEIRKLRTDFDSLGKKHCLSELQKIGLEEDLEKCRSEYDLLEGKHRLSELRKLEMEEELKKFRSECDLLEKKYCLCETHKLEMEKELKKCRSECDLLEEKNSLSELQKVDLEEKLKKCRSECDLLEKKYCVCETQKLEMEEELKKCRSECNLLEEKHCLCEIQKLDLEEKLKKHRSESVCDLQEKKPSVSELKKLFTEHDLKKRKIETCEKATEEEFNGVENEYKRKIMELTKENEKMKEEIKLYSKKYSEHWSRIDGIEELLEGLLETNASNFMDGNISGHSPDTTSRPDRNLTEIHNSHLQKEVKSMLKMAQPKEGAAKSAKKSSEIASESGHASSQASDVAPSAKSTPKQSFGYLRCQKHADGSKRIAVESTSLDTLFAPPTTSENPVPLPVKSTSKLGLEESPLPKDLEMACALNPTDEEDQYTHYAAMQSLLKSNRMAKDRALQASERRYSEKILTAEKVISTKRKEVSKLKVELKGCQEELKGSKEARDKAVGEVEKIKAELKKAEESLAKYAVDLKKFEEEKTKWEEQTEQKLEQARKKAVQDYKASDECLKDIEALTQPTLRFGYNLAIDHARLVWPEITSDHPSLIYDPEEPVEFEVRLKQFQTTGDIKEFWPADSDSEEGQTEGCGTMHMGSMGNRENMPIAGNLHNSPVALSNSNLHESEKVASDAEKRINESVTAAIDVEVCVKEQAISTSSAAVDRPEPQIINLCSDSSSSDSDVESITDSVAMDALVKNIS